MTLNASIKGLQEAQAASLQAAATIQGDGRYGLDNAVQDVTVKAHRFAVANTPVDTGAWRASHRPEVHGLTGRVFIDPAATNPKSGSKPAVYGPELELIRGDRYAVYKRTVNEAGPQVLDEVGERLRKALPQ